MTATEIIKRPRVSKRSMLIGGVAVAVLAAMALDTTVVRIGSEQDARADGFSPDAFGAETFPRVRSFVTENAVEAGTLVAAIAQDKSAAGEQYGSGGMMPVIPVTFSGVVGEGKGGVYDVAVPEAEGVRIRVQTGPAVNGTDLRDAPGDIAFGQFKNQIEYQDAGSGINRAMKAAVLDGIDRDSLPGKTIEVTGVFKLLNPKMWLVTPVEVSVQ
ncbi:DUF2291 domain-containing protein [Sagittula sp. NFXS13]|uniref:Putative lipoprotein n=1 Tax=Sagittula marina TaxID=943940 RepID=A0A7W6GU62_9RHOB|nr:DUF2291 domain-containing protein [Sagittula marina]MBB3987168.1 putative lipoprotein [Sagittula marina]